MLHNWIFRPWRHNRTFTKLIPLLKLKARPYWILTLVGIFPLLSLLYSYQGIVHDIFPNLPFIKADVLALFNAERKGATQKENLRYSCYVS